MRSIGKAAITTAIVSLTALIPGYASAEDTGHRIAVVDVAYIFKTHPGIKAQVEKVENHGRGREQAPAIQSLQSPIRLRTK